MSSDCEETGELRYGDIVVISKDGNRGARFPFMGRALIGRMKSCDISIKLPYVSRKHAFLSIDESGQVVFENLCEGAADMTLLNNDPVKNKVTLKHGDVFQIADRRFQWLYSDQYMMPNEEVIFSAKGKKKAAVLRENKLLLNSENKDTANTPSKKDARENGAKEIDDIFAKAKPYKSALPTPVRQGIIKKSKKSEQKTKKSALPTPIRNQILAKSSNNDDEIMEEDAQQQEEELIIPKQTLTKMKANKLGTPLREQIKSRKPKTPAAGGDDKDSEKKNRLATPLRKDIEGRVKKDEKARKLGTPIRLAIQSKHKDTLVEEEEMAKKDKKKALATPIRKEIQERQQTKKQTMDKKKLGTPLRREIEASKETEPVEENARKMATPLRKEIQSKTKGSVETQEEKMNRLATPIRKEIQNKGKAAKDEDTVMTMKKKKMATPLRKEIQSNDKQLKTSKKQAMAAKMATPLRKEIEGKRNDERQAEKMKRLATPLRKDIQNVKPKVKKALPTPIRKDIASAAIKEKAASKFKFLPMGARKFLEPVSNLSKRDILMAQLEANGLNPDRFEDWSIEELEQRVQSLEDEKDLAQLEQDYDEYDEGEYEYDEEEDEDDEEDDGVISFSTPKREVHFEGTLKEFPTPRKTGERPYERYNVHWRYSDYGSGADTDSTVSQDDSDEESEDDSSSVPATSEREVVDDEYVGSLSDMLSTLAVGSDCGNEEMIAEVDNQLASAMESMEISGVEESPYKELPAARVLRSAKKTPGAQVKSVKKNPRTEPKKTPSTAAKSATRRSARIATTTGRRYALRSGKKVADGAVEQEEELIEQHPQVSHDGDSTILAEAIAEEEVEVVEEEDQEEMQEEQQEVIEEDNEEENQKLVEEEGKEDMQEQAVGDDNKVEIEVEQEEEVEPKEKEAMAEETEALQEEIMMDAEPVPETENAPEETNVSMEEEPSVDEEQAREHFMSLTVRELKPLLKLVDEDQKGKKNELVDRLVKCYMNGNVEMRSSLWDKEKPHDDSRVEEDEEDEDGDDDEEEEEEEMATEKNDKEKTEQEVVEEEEEVENTTSEKTVTERVRKTILIPCLLKVQELKTALQERGIEAKGKKADLIDLLQEAIISEEQNFREVSDDGEVFIKENHEMLWTPVRRDIAGELCDAVVVGYLPPTDEDPYELFRVRFLDGDVEDLELDEVKAGAELFQE